MIVTRSKKKETAKPNHPDIPGRSCPLPVIPKKIPACSTETAIKTMLTVQKKLARVNSRKRSCSRFLPIAALPLIAATRTATLKITATTPGVTVGLRNKRISISSAFFQLSSCCFFTRLARQSCLANALCIIINRRLLFQSIATEISTTEVIPSLKVCCPASFIKKTPIFLKFTVGPIRKIFCTLCAILRIYPFSLVTVPATSSAVIFDQ